MSTFGLAVAPLAPGAVLVRVHGDLDFEHAYAFEEALRRLEAAEATSAIVLDFRDVSFVDSSGMSALMSARRRAARAGRRLVIVQGSAAVRRIFALVGLEDVFEIVSEVPAELAGAGEPAPVRPAG